MTPRFSSLLALLALNWPSSLLAQGRPAPSPEGPLPAWTQALDEVLTLDIWHIESWRVGCALGALLLGFFCRAYLLGRLLRPLEGLAARTKTQLDDVLIEHIQRPLGWLVIVLGAYLAVLVLQLPEGLAAGALLLLHTLGLMVVAWMLYNGVEVVSLGLDRFTQRTESQMDDHLVPLVRKIMRVSIVVVTVVMVIQQWGYDVTSLIAGLGLGGLAFALAAQQTVANLFGSIMIFTDRPFAVGDWIKTPQGEGVVEEIGLRSTKVRTFSKSLISVPNADVAGAPIENFSHMTQRRIKAIVGLTYDTKPAQIEFIVEGIREMIRTREGFNQESYYVNFTGFGASSLDVMIYCFTLTTNWGEYMDLRQGFYLEVMRLIERAGSAFAFPSRSIYLGTDSPTQGLPREVEAWFEAQATTLGHAEKTPGGMGEVGDGMSSS